MSWRAAIAIGSVSALLIAAAPACSDDGTTDGGGGDGGGTGGSDTGGGGGVEQPACDETKVCMAVELAGDPAPGRLAVVWFRFEGSVGHDPTVAYQAAFDPLAERVEIPLAEVTLPPDVDLLCTRGCEDPATCPCTSTFQAGVAYIFIVTDDNANDQVDLAEILDSSGYVGISNAALVWSATTESDVQAPFDATFPAGVVEGLHAYSIVESSQYEPESSDTVFGLRTGTDAF